jgi:hypothetical protein
VPLGWTYRTTKTDQMIMSYLRSAYSCPRMSKQRPLPGYDVKPLDTKGNQPWVRSVNEQSSDDYYLEYRCTSRALGAMGIIEYDESEYATSGQLTEEIRSGSTIMKDYCENFSDQILSIFRSVHKEPLSRGN